MKELIKSSNPRLMFLCITMSYIWWKIMKLLLRCSLGSQISPIDSKPWEKVYIEPKKVIKI